MRFALLRPPLIHAPHGCERGASGAAPSPRSQGPSRPAGGRLRRALTARAARGGGFLCAGADCPGAPHPCRCRHPAARSTVVALQAVDRPCARPLVKASGRDSPPCVRACRVEAAGVRAGCSTAPSPLGGGSRWSRCDTRSCPALREQRRTSRRAQLVAKYGAPCAPEEGPGLCRSAPRARGRLTAASAIHPCTGRAPSPFGVAARAAGAMRRALFRCRR